MKDFIEEIMMSRTILGNGRSENPKWYWEVYVNPTSWALPLMVTIRMGDIYSFSFLFVTLHFMRNDFYVVRW